MVKLPVFVVTVALVTAGPLSALAGDPLALHHTNPSYLSFRGKATILVGSGEHYGAVVNPDFDYRRYLDTLAADGLNLTRVFVGTYYEKPGDFGIGANTLAPGAGPRARPVGAQRGAGGGRRRPQARPLALGPGLLRAAPGLRGRGGEARDRRRGRPLLLVLRRRAGRTPR